MWKFGINEQLSSEDLSDFTNTHHLKHVKVDFL